MRGGWLCQQYDSVAYFRVTILNLGYENDLFPSTLLACPSNPIRYSAS